MAIFNSYVSLPEGTTHFSRSIIWQVQAKLLDDGSQGSPPSALLRLLPSEAERLVADFDGQVLQGLTSKKYMAGSSG